MDSYLIILKCRFLTLKIKIFKWFLVTRLYLPVCFANKNHVNITNHISYTNVEL